MPVKSSLASPRHSIATAALAVAVAALLHGCAAPGNTAAPNGAAKPGVEDNFGYPLMFSPAKMDPSADPRQDFRRYAAGRWLDAATIPSDQAQVSGYLVMARAVQAQLLAIVEDAAKASASAPKGSPRQQVGDFYASGMDERRLAELPIGSRLKHQTLFVKGQAVASDAPDISGAGRGSAALATTREGDHNVVKVGEDERYEIPNPLLTGG